MSHTPGPWEVYNDWYIRPVNGWTHATVFPPHQGTMDASELLANARLMAAAPELLEALEELVEASQKPLGIGMSCVTLALEVIKKAKGEA